LLASATHLPLRHHLDHVVLWELEGVATLPIVLAQPVHRPQVEASSIVAWVNHHPPHAHCGRCPPGCAAPLDLLHDSRTRRRWQRKAPLPTTTTTMQAAWIRLHPRRWVGESMQPMRIMRRSYRLCGSASTRTAWGCWTWTRYEVQQVMNSKITSCDSRFWCQVHYFGLVLGGGADVDMEWRERFGRWHTAPVPGMALGDMGVLLCTQTQSLAE
jgi:hypothetical protein